MLMAGYLVMATGMAIGAIAGHGVALLGFAGRLHVLRHAIHHL